MKTFLISAYACEPGKGSEPGVGWNWAMELAKENRVLVITRSNNKPAIDARCSADPNPNLTFFYCDVPRKFAFWKRGQRGLHLYYVLWQVCCYRLAQKICAAQQIDFAMTLTFGNMWLPTFMHRLPCAFIWGPVGGGEGIPKALCPRFSLKKRAIEKVRGINKIVHITNPWFIQICKKAKTIIVRTPDSLNCIPSKYRSKCMTLIETGISTMDISFFETIRKERQPEDHPKDFVICGNLVPKKLVSLAVEAFSLAFKDDKSARLHIIGDGPEQQKVRSLIGRLGLCDKIIMHGGIKREDALKLMASCRALIVTSAFEGGSWVLFEAMLLKMPVICFDTSGMSVVVTPETGVLIPVTRYEKAKLLFGQAMRKILSSDHEARSMGSHGYLRVIECFTWESKVKHLITRLEESQA